MTQSTDTKLLSLLQHGSKAAYKSVFDMHYRSLVVTAYKILKDEQISKDAAQEVFLELWKNKERLHEGIVLLPYLKRSVINRALNILKSRKHHMSSGAEPLDYLQDQTRQPDEVTEDLELETVVYRAIDELPDRCRAVFMLCRMEGLSHREISAKLDISTKTIENQITKALKHIRKKIAFYQALTSIVTFVYLNLHWGIDVFQLYYIYYV